MQRMRNSLAVALAMLGLGLSAMGSAFAADDALAKPINSAVQKGCDAMAGVLGSIDMQDCLTAGLAPTGGYTVQGRPILMREYLPLSPRRPQARVLLVGGIHGDEYSSFSVVFRWMRTLKKHHSGAFHWRIVPGLNLDGLNAGPAVRTNANGIDLNRNFPTPNWHENKEEYWVRFTGSDPRRFPGDAPLSEPESQWLFNEIETFKPDAIVALHAPFGVLDFDGPSHTPPHHLGYLYLNRLGTYPGSLGNYAGVQEGIPVITMELPHAGIMPTEKQSEQVWFDLIYWLKRNVEGEGFAPKNLVQAAPVEPPLLMAGYSPRDSCKICQPASGSFFQNCCLRDTAWKLLLE